MYWGDLFKWGLRDENDELITCQRCDESPAAEWEESEQPRLALCLHCKWALRSEIDSGHAYVADFLKKYASWADWLAQHEAA